MIAINMKKIFKIVFLTFIVNNVFAQQEQLSSCGNFKTVFSHNYVYDSINDIHSLQTITDTNNNTVSGTVMFNPMCYMPNQVLTFNYSYTSIEDDTALVSLFSIDTIVKQKIDLGTYPLIGNNNTFELPLDSIINGNFCIGLEFKSTSSTFSKRKVLASSELIWSGMQVTPENLLNSPNYIISPNPTSGIATIEALNGDISFVSIQNGNGLNISNYSYNQLLSTQIQIDISAQIAGIYSINVIIDGQPTSINLIKN